MSDIAITVAHNEARLAGTLAFLNLGPGVARIRIYGTVRPASVDTAPGAAPLVEVALADPAGSIAGGVLTLIAGGDAMVASSGGAVWARVVNGEGTTAFDCDVSDTSGGATVRLPNTTLFAGGLTRLASGVLG